MNYEFVRYYNSVWYHLYFMYSVFAEMTDGNNFFWLKPLSSGQSLWHLDEDNAHVHKEIAREKVVFVRNHYTLCVFFIPLGYHKIRGSTRQDAV